MNIDDLIMHEGKKALAEKLGSSPLEKDPFLGRYVIVRTYTAGVFAGTLIQRNDNKVVLENVRRLWRWHTANNGVSLSEVAVHGINQGHSKICCVEPLKEVEPIEISPASDAARKSIEGAKSYVV